MKPMKRVRMKKSVLVSGATVKDPLIQTVEGEEYTLTDRVADVVVDGGLGELVEDDEPQEAAAQEAAAQEAAAQEAAAQEKGRGRRKKSAAKKSDDEPDPLE